ncbi:GntR family transcriptional regulator [Cyclobacterium amurskyense]|jgi:GntR family transcriptional regulator|uniref:Transcriptional regulator, GntR family with UTRA sensor domain n=1 Tax=Cyclobacterium amurskyense TaxID=320787 RepID=A0A0H4PF39_9BACT|nr:GntR family transcriptional regulator [Cyclobacterium amurskyense]AKP51705.1 Transcriptional regulator, GntR family with UTRA sensor domain [Cyclobacterium amurskyense]|tara:strand:- start:18482 stop:19252 length:771 start_codon:yes stop_codon:yes gene_type:complete
MKNRNQSKKPKFIVISEQIISKIISGELLPGEKVPSENELIHNFQVSNTTARKSLQEIESRGYAQRIKGKGTFVLNKTEDHHLVRTLGSIDATRRGFDEGLKVEGFKPKTIVLEKTVLDHGVSAEISGKNYIIEGPVLKVHQLRYADEMLLKDETKYISLKLCPKINMLSTDLSYFKVYEDKYQLKISDIKQNLSAIILPPDDPTNNFEYESALPVFVLDSVVLSRKDAVLELEKSLYRGDKYKFAIIAHPEYNGN